MSIPSDTRRLGLPGLPLDFAPLKYLHLTGGKYVDSGIATHGESTIMADAEYVSISGNRVECLGGFMTSATDILPRSTIGVNNGKFICGWNATFSATFCDTRRHRFVYSEHSEKPDLNTLYIDGEKISLSSGSLTLPQNRNDAGLTWYIGGRNTAAGTLNAESDARHFSWVICNNDGTHIADLVPVIHRRQGISGMWCRVRRMFLPVQQDS